MAYLETVFIEGNAGAILDGPVGTPTAQAVTIQGNPSGAAVPVSGIVSISNFPSTQQVSIVSATSPVAVTQGTTPWVITGAITQGTSPWIVSGTITTAPPSNASTNITQWDGVALGAPSNYGTSPGAVPVIGVNAFISNTVPVTLASTTITGSVAVTGAFFQATQPVSIAAPVAVTGTFWPTTQPISGAISFTAPQHVIVDSATLGTVTISGSVSVSNFPATQAVSSTQLPAALDTNGFLKVHEQGTVPVTGTFWQATQPVSGSVSVSNFPSTFAVTQGTSPWVVSLASTTITGTVDVSDRAARLLGHVTVDNASLAVTGSFWQATQPVSLVSTTITGTVAVTQSTSPWVVSGTVTTTPSGLQNVNLTQLNSIALGSPSNYGTSPGAIAVQGVNAFITNTPAVTLASTTITGTVAVTGAFFQATQPVSGTVAVSNFPATQPVSGTITANQGTSPWVVSLVSTTITGTVAVTQSTSPWVISGTVTSTPSGTQNVNLAQMNGVALGSPSAYGTSPGIVNVQGVNAFITNTPAVTLASTTITGTVAVTGTFFQAIQPVSGTVAVSNFPATQPISGAVDVTDRAARLLGHVTVDNASIAVTGTFFQTTQPVSLASTTITGTVAVTQSTSPWVVSGTVTTTPSGTQNVNLTQLNSIALGSPSLYGTSPGAVSVQGVNAFITNTPAVTLASTTITGTVAVTGAFFQATQPVSIAGTVAVTQSTSPWVVSLASTTITGTVSDNLTQWASTVLGVPTNFGTTPGAVIAGSVNSSLFIGTTAAATAAAGIQKVGIVGNTGATLDSPAAGGTAPTSAVLASAEYNSTPVVLTAGQAAALQSDYEGSLFVKPIRRSQTVAKATTIASTVTATAVLAAQAAGIFADISNLVVAVTPAATTAIVFTVTLSDGTNSYIYDMDTGTLANSTGATALIVNFNPPLPATTAATAWTLACSVATVTVHVTAVAVLQKAS